MIHYLDLRRSMRTPNMEYDRATLREICSTFGQADESESNEGS
jgi:hypothetical protein